MPELTCFRLLDAESPAGPLAEAVRQVNISHVAASIHILDPKSFLQIPNAPFAYWVEEKIRRMYKEFKAFEADGRSARAGLCTGDDFRFIRCHWETPIEVEHATNRRWWHLAKGGAVSPFYADIYLCVDWRAKGADIELLPGGRVQNVEYYFHPGAYQTLRSLKFAPHLTPKGCVYSHNGFQFFAPEADLLFLLGLTNSSFFESLYRLNVGADERPLFVAGVMQLVPVPEVNRSLKNEIENLAKACWLNRRRLAVRSERSPWFRRPAIKASTMADSQAAEAALRTQLETEFLQLQASIEKLVLKAYGDVAPIEGGHSARSRPAEAPDEEAEPEDTGDLARSAASFAVGLTFGRWKSDAGLPDEYPPEDPLAALPTSPPGFSTSRKMLYHVAESGADEGFADLVRVNLVNEFGADAEEAICAKVGCVDLRGYLDKPGAFFADHLATYSKSRRKAPIYWPLSTRSGDFVIWVYYPKLEGDSLTRLITEVLDPRLRRLNEELGALAAEGRVSGRKAKLESLRLELAEMRQDFQELIAKGYQPNLNDGVLITACPLAKYFRHAGFRKNLEACWKELSRGEYDWSHLAMAMWPERVLAVCKKDRSIAIAHGREDLCPAEPAKVTRGRKKKDG